MNGRLNRQPYLYYRLALLPVIFLAMTFQDFSWLLLIVAGCSVFLAIGRLHDLDINAGWGVLMLVPVISLFFGIYLLFTKGTDGPNQYGEDPLKERGALNEGPFLNRNEYVYGSIWEDFDKNEKEMNKKLRALINKGSDDDFICLEIKKILDMGDISFGIRKQELLLEIEAARKKQLTIKKVN